MNSITLFYLIIAILVVEFLVDTLMDYLNSRRFGDPVPEELSDVYDPEEYTRSQAYKKANYSFGLVSSTFSIILIIVFLSLGGFQWVDQLVRQVTDNPIGMALLFFGIIMLGSDLLMTPFAYYRTFVIEERFGFNKSNLRLFITDKIKGWLLLGILGGGVLSLVILFFQRTGSNFWLYAWGLIAVFSVFLNLFYSKLIVPLFNKQEPLEEGSLKQSIQDYAGKVGFELEKIFVIDGSKRSTKANAYFSGFGRQKRVTLYDTLIQDLEEDEIVAVLAHEVGHYKRRHIISNLLVSTALTGFTLFLLSLFINNPEVSMAIGVEQPSFHAALIGFGLLYSPVSQLTGLAMNYMSRQFEYQADRYARETFGSRPLIHSLKKLSRNSLSNLTPHPAYVFMHYSHPPLIARVRRLQA
ncbi:M48 family metallopeptidase [Muriicola marianensis]|uniref:Peptidase M48 n=1 Tax=Muriicola marianensis TaxID=1324801 RepID=A0ABQ1R438_9FLAO|nr:M48 family metallopeptidase [Muriicola marianensis]GGD57472.1 peptidase M48 [Muriicola marianensis]